MYARMELKYDCCVNSLWYIHIIGGTGEGGWARQVVLHLVVWYDGQVNSILHGSRNGKEIALSMEWTV